MKKSYAKPEILFEDFSVSCNIAACDVPVPGAEGSCGYPLGNLPGNMTVFISEPVCNYTAVNLTPDGLDGSYNEICYNVPIDQSLFTS